MLMPSHNGGAWGRSAAQLGPRPQLWQTQLPGTEGGRGLLSLHLCHWPGQAESTSQAEELMGCRQLARIREPAVRPGRAVPLVPRAQATRAPIDQLKGTPGALKSRRSRGLRTSPTHHPPPSSPAALCHAFPSRPGWQSRKSHSDGEAAGGAGLRDGTDPRRSAGGREAKHRQPPW